MRGRNQPQNQGLLRFQFLGSKITLNETRSLCGDAQIKLNDFFPGLLTVDPTERLSMHDLRCSPWLMGNGVLSTPLMTPGILTGGSSARSAELGISLTFSAFHQAHREGFTLQVC